MALDLVSAYKDDVVHTLERDDVPSRPKDTTLGKVLYWKYFFQNKDSRLMSSNNQEPGLVIALSRVAITCT